MAGGKCARLTDTSPKVDKNNLAAIRLQRLSGAVNPARPKINPCNLKTKNT